MGKTLMAHAAPLVEVSESVAMLACTVHSPVLHAHSETRALLAGRPFSDIRHSTRCRPLTLMSFLEI